MNPAGDIPDNQLFVPFTTPDGAVVVSVPQGWARSSDGPATVFTDKFNSVRVEDAPRPSAADVASSRAEDVPQLQAAVPGFTLGDVHTVRRTAGAAAREPVVALVTLTLTCTVATAAVQHLGEELFEHAGAATHVSVDASRPTPIEQSHLR